MSSSKSTTNQTASTNTDQTANTSASGTSTPTNPDWSTSAIQGLLSQIQGLSGTNPTSYVAPTTANQNQASSNAGIIGSMAPSQTEAATGAAAGGAAYQPQQVTGSTAAPGISSYLNPFTSAVTAPTLQGLNQANQLALNDVNSGAELAGGYGGSRQGVAQGLTNQLFGNTAASTLANLNQANYTSALGASNDDANRAQQAATSNQQAGLTGQGINLAGAGLLGNLAQAGQGDLASTGATQQATNQATAQAPLSVLQSLQQMLSGLPLNLFSGTSTTGSTSGTQTGATSGTSNGTTTSNPGLLGSLLQISQIVANGAKAAAGSGG